MDESEKNTELKDRGGRRRIADRRKYSPSDYFPERRILRHRRNGSDRRSRQNLRIQRSEERRRAFRDEDIEMLPSSIEQNPWPDSDVECI